MLTLPVYEGGGPSGRQTWFSMAKESDVDGSPTGNIASGIPGTCCISWWSSGSA